MAENAERWLEVQVIENFGDAPSLLAVPFSILFGTVFDSCFSNEVLPDEIYHIYSQEIVTELHEQYSDYAFLTFNFRGRKEKRVFRNCV